MSQYQIRITKQARKDIEKLTPKLRRKLKTILVEVIANNPYEGKNYSVILSETTHIT